MAKKPKDQELPGMEIAKDRSLHRYCGSIAEVRASLNDAKTTEKGLLGKALARMQETQIQVYKAHGVELIHVHGDDKIRVRLISDDSGEEAEQSESEGA